MAGHSRRLALINRGAVNGTACHFCRRTARPTLMLGRDARVRRFCRPRHWNSTGSRLEPCKDADCRCRTRPTCSTKATQSRSGAVAQPLRFTARGEKCLRPRRCREVFAARQDNVEMLIAGAEHGHHAARQRRRAAAEPSRSRCAALRRAARGGKCLRPRRWRCREEFVGVQLNPISEP